MPWNKAKIVSAAPSCGVAQVTKPTILAISGKIDNIHGSTGPDL
jgi:hypothetical protein